jgi:hypothetical protein
MLKRGGTIGRHTCILFFGSDVNPKRIIKRLITRRSLMVVGAAVLAMV